MARMLSLNEAKGDDNVLRHGYDRHVGMDMGDPTANGTYKYGQYNPMFFNREGATLPLEGMYRGWPCFLIGGGPSLATLDLNQLNRPGVLTFGMNNSSKVFRPDLWTSVDDPSRFLYSVWLDPRIKKFVPMAAFPKGLWDSTSRGGKDNWAKAKKVVGTAPM